MDWLRMQGAFAYTDGWHPFVAALEHGSDELNEFYDKFSPSDLGSMYLLDKPCDSPPWLLPWISRSRYGPPRGEAGLGAEHGVSFYGPATPEKVRVEYARILTIDTLIRRNGFDPHADGGIVGHFLRRGDEFRFFVRGGKHRTAAIAFQGHQTATVFFRSNWPRVVDVRDSADWPHVRSGVVSQESAEAVFHRYFDFDGTQQKASWTSKA